MTPTSVYDYDLLLAQARELILKDQGKTLHSMNDIAKALGVSYTTLKSGFIRKFNITTFKQLVQHQVKDERKIESPDAGTIELEFEGNFGEIRAVDVRGQIRTVDDLLKVAKVNPAEWEVTDPTVKKWDVALKLKKGDVDEVQVVPSFYVAAKLRAKHPKAFQPVIQPVTITGLPKLPKSLKKEPQGQKTRRALILNDPQVGFRRRLHMNELTPFHDRRVLDLALQVAEHEQIDHVSYGGDWGDYSEWSNKFMPEPEFFWTTQPALIEQAWWFTQFRRALPKADMKLVEGNHDKRLSGLIVANMKQAYLLKAVDELELPPALSVPRLLALHQLDVEYVDGYPDNGYWLNKNVFIAHGDVVRTAPGATALELTRRQAFTTIFGHIHRRELVARRMKTADGDLVYSAFCPGCLCHVDGRVPGSKSDQQWQQGFAIIEYTEQAETIIPIAVQDGAMMYNGKIWKARERDAEINEMLRASLEQVTEEKSQS